MAQAADLDRRAHGARAAPVLRVETLGTFAVWIDEREVSDFGRTKARALLQFLITFRRRSLRKEEIIERLWPELPADRGDRDFRVALNTLENALEPGRPRRRESAFVHRTGLAYGMPAARIDVDADRFEEWIRLGNAALREGSSPAEGHAAAIGLYSRAVGVYHGDYLPDCLYEDWASAERERLQTLALGTLTRLAELLLGTDPLESLRLAERAIAIEPSWEDAYRAEIRAHLALGNRAMAIRAYRRCAEVLRAEFDLEPLPETRALIAELS